MTRIYLATWDGGPFSQKKIPRNGKLAQLITQTNVLSSYKHTSPNSFYLSFLKTIPFFFLDSGAFTFLEAAVKKGTHPEKKTIETYADQYAEFVRENRIQRYIEIDLDIIYGYEYVLKLRDRIEKRVGWQSVPAWHLNRGQANFRREARDYPYVCCGGIPSSGHSTVRDDYMRILPALSHICNENGTGLHVLGFTPSNLADLSWQPTSVDSSSWFSSVIKYGYIYRFNGRKLVAKRPPRGATLFNTDYDDRLSQSAHAWIQWAQHLEKLHPTPTIPPPDGY